MEKEERGAIMAGGQFNRLIGKERPGTYINFESGRNNNTVKNRYKRNSNSSTSQSDIWSS